MREQIEEEITEFEDQVIAFFCDGVRLLGLPRSLGEIYGVLYITKEPLSLDDLVVRLDISKGSASQGVRLLQELKAIRKVDGPMPRRAYYEPDVELKRLVRGFIGEQVRPHLASGEIKLGNLRSEVDTLSDKLPASEKDFYHRRLQRLEGWSSRARLVLPMLQRLLT